MSSPASSLAGVFLPRAARSPTPEGAARALQLAELVPTALGALAAGAGPPAVSSEGVAIQYGAGGPSGHFKGLADRMLAMPQCDLLLDAMFDGETLLSFPEQDCSGIDQSVQRGLRAHLSSFSL